MVGDQMMIISLRHTADTICLFLLFIIFIDYFPWDWTEKVSFVILRETTGVYLENLSLTLLDFLILYNLSISWVEIREYYSK